MANSAIEACDQEMERRAASALAAEEAERDRADEAAQEARERVEHEASDERRRANCTDIGGTVIDDAFCSSPLQATEPDCFSYAGFLGEEVDLRGQPDGCFAT